ncbi:hypothetical protein ACT3UM_06750 [Halomonas sp. AOP13-D3-9]
MTKNTCFISKRQDGLGERLRAMLNAIALSQVNNADFKFNWKDSSKDHGSGKLTDVFSGEFINNHHIPAKDLNKFQLVDNFYINKIDGTYFCDQNISKRIFKNYPDDYFYYRSELGKAFQKIDFSDSVKKAIESAYHVEFSNNCVALHLRAGDLVYGNYQQSVSFVSKAISYPVALKIIEDVARTGADVLVFGQDVELIEMLANQPRVISAHCLMPSSFGEVEAAFFDMILMSRCRKIYAGSSGFAVLASIIGNIDHIRPEKLFSDTETVNIITDEIKKNKFYNGVSNQQKSFACKSALVIGNDILDNKLYMEMTDYGKKADPDNMAFAFFDAWNSYKIGHENDAEKKMKSIVFCDDEKFQKFVYSNFSTPVKASVFSKLFKASVIESYRNKPATAEIYKLLTRKSE